MRAANLALRFALELGALGTLGYWGGTAATGPFARVALALALPLAAGAFWGTFVAPRARVVLPSVVRMALGLVVFGTAAGALADRGHGRLAVGGAALAILNAVLMLAWRQDRPVGRGGVPVPGGR